ncbi:hypothetical protein MRB53_006565 [Persea americana]|uniref:Uncharacterized protein n=1 Tax=Persea americana TaxID=3435 RepID=A0ACC2MGD2_PERAE|nr:hypothetical protein MRB53_006565 [Persea americana]
MCGICLLEEGKVVRGQIDCCNHYFCYVCIMEWAKKESLCPMCKQRFRSIRRPHKDGVFACERIFEVPIRDQVYNPIRNDLRRPSNTHACVYCTECQSSKDECLLLCDLCNSAMHIFCVGLGVTVPEGSNKHKLKFLYELNKRTPRAYSLQTP